jgi:predicted phage terminase large subunit-like protein
LIIDKLEAVAKGELTRLAFFLPPGSAKSTYASVLAPPWFLANNPGSALIAASHTTDLAEHFGRRCRNLIVEKEKFLGYALRKDSKAAGQWMTTNGSEYFAAGVGSGITGRRADLAIIDDPVKSFEDATSEVYRETQWNWYLFDLKTRLKPDAAIVLIQTRWHEDDLAGRILAAEGDRWTIVKLPMIAGPDDPLGRKPGERLWPGYFTETQVLEAQSDSRVWNSLYQQNPTPEEGDYFKAEWLVGYRSYDELPKHLRIYAAADWAVSLRQDADATCFGAVGVDERGEIWVLPDLWWKRADTGESTEAFVDFLSRRKPITTWSEAGHISKSVGPFLYKRMRERGVFAVVEEVTPAKDKPTRAQAIRGRMKMGMVHFPIFAHWWPQAKHELLTFPVGKHDDFVDWLAHVGMGLSRMVSATVPKVVTPARAYTFAWLKGEAKRSEQERLMALDDW